MMKALAILKDSLREAKDSKVLLVMLILSGIFLILLASIGYHPVPVDKVFEHLPGEFRTVPFNRGKDPISVNRSVNYHVTDIQTLREALNPASGKYAFTLHAVSDSTPEQKKDSDPKGETKKPVASSDAFTESVQIWNSRAEQLDTNLKHREFIDPSTPLPSLTFMVTSEAMEGFIREQLAFHFNMNVTECTRKEAPLVGPQEFHVVIENSDPRAWPSTVSILFNTWKLSEIPVPTGMFVWIVQDQIINGVGAAIALMIGIFITAFFLPEMLRKGAVDLLLAKPLTRGQLLFWKYTGGLTFMLILAVVNIGGTWLITGLRSGVWNHAFLLAIPMLVFSFAVLYAVSTLMAILTRSVVVSILVTCFFAVILYGSGRLYTWHESKLKSPSKNNVLPEWAQMVVTTTHAILPRTKDLDLIASRLTAEAMTESNRTKIGFDQFRWPSWWTTFGVSFAWIGGLLGLAWWKFATRDY